MRKVNEKDIRENIGLLMYEQQVFQQSGNDEAVDRTELKIEKLRCQLKLVEKEEKAHETSIEITD
jgi:hypothetical protein